MWANTMPLIRNDGFTRGYKDWRTFARLQMFNDIANKRFKAAGLPIFPEWNMTVPFLMAPVADVAHWHESMSMQHLGPLLNAICN
jgi:hypothetical protein